MQCTVNLIQPNGITVYINNKNKNKNRNKNKIHDALIKHNQFQLQVLFIAKKTNKIKTKETKKKKNTKIMLIWCTPINPQVIN